MLKGKSIVIIGGTTGLGFSAAKAFVREGAKIVVVGRKPESCLSAELVLGKNGRSIAADATNESTAKNAIELCISEFGSFDGGTHETSRVDDLLNLQRNAPRLVLRRRCGQPWGNNFGIRLVVISSKRNMRQR